MDWIGFWKLVIYGSLGVFAVLSIWVTIAGFGDIQRMFAELRRQRDSNSTDDVQ